MQIELSIIIPHYNSVDTLEVLLSSIPVVDSVQVIVIDDNSNVSLEDVSRNFPHVLFLSNTTGVKGAGASRNLGLDVASGMFLMFADADDYFVPGSFDIVWEYIHADYDLVVFSPTSVIHGDNVLSTRHTSYSLLVEDFVDNGSDDVKFKFYVPWSKLVSRRLVVDNGIRFDEVIASNDVNFSVKCGYYSKRFACDVRNVYCVVFKEGTLTRLHREDILDSRFESMCRYNDFLVSKGLSHRQGAMSGHLKNSLRFGLYKFLYRFFYCKYKRYPIFYDFKHLCRILKKIVRRV